MRLYIRCELLRQIYSVSLMLCGQILTRLCMFIHCRFSSRPVGILSESTTGFYLVLGIPLIISVVFEFVVFGCVLRCVTVPVSGSHSKCAGLTLYHLAFYQDFHDSAAPYDDLIWAVVRAVRGGAIANLRKTTCEHVSLYLY